jgi:tyrosyl-tRNA synthetase
VERFQLCRSVAEECIADKELLELLRKKANPIAYDGFEPSGRMHIAQVCGARLWRWASRGQRAGGGKAQQQPI